MKHTRATITFRITLFIALCGCGDIADGDPSMWDPTNDLGGKDHSFGASNGAGGSGSTAVAAVGSTGGAVTSGGSAVGSGGAGGAAPPPPPPPPPAVVHGCAVASSALPGGEPGSGPCSVDVQFQTKSINGKYAPKNVGAAWIEDVQMSFVKTLQTWGNKRLGHVHRWAAASGYNQVDAITGATMKVHGSHQLKWDCRDAASNDVPPGSYRAFLEVTENNSALPFQPVSQCVFVQFTIGAGSAATNVPSQTGFADIAVSVP